MAQPINRYKADIREIQFLLFEQFKLQELLGNPPFEEWGADECKLVLNEVHKFACEVTGPINQLGDQHGCQLTDGRVITPPGLKEAWSKLYESGWKLLSVEPEYGGQGAPRTLQRIADEMLIGSNIGFSLYASLTVDAAEVIENFGTQEQRNRYCEKMFQGLWAGTMCLTEAQAGSDVAAVTSTATKNPDGTYSISGSKIFISGGDHDLTENIIHLVLARIPGGTSGTKGISLFIVPSFRVNPDGSLADRNDVVTASIEHKMGIKASSTAVLNFGDSDNCIGELVGEVEHQGMRQMFQMMNSARVFVGLQGLSVAATSYLNALEFARERKQGVAYNAGRDPMAPKVAIVEHPDIKRMLLDMKARTEGIRSLIVHFSIHQDKLVALQGKHKEAEEYHLGQIEVLTPLIKAYATDQSFLICTNAIQTCGGAGYISDYPFEQNCRDSKILSIYEGTNHIQAQDLVWRKMNLAGGKYIQQFMDYILEFITAEKANKEIKSYVEILENAFKSVEDTIRQLRDWSKKGDFGPIFLYANSVLEMFSELIIARLLLEGALVANDKLSTVSESHPDRFFYQGKMYSAFYFTRSILPAVIQRAKLISDCDRSALDISDQYFATV